jgi:hypothetical protein
MIEEVWKDIKGYEGIYQVSNMGNVKSLSRISQTKTMVRKIKGRLLKPSFDKRGYGTVILCHDFKTKKYIRVHQLVAIEFLGHEQCGFDKVIDHINNEKKDNRLDNLQITTSRNNLSKDRKGASSKYTGVYWHKKDKVWNSAIRISGVKKHLGTFKDEISASIAYDNALKNLIK